MILTREVISGLMGQASAHDHGLREAFNLPPLGPTL
jgi:hypothetical protein